VINVDDGLTGAIIENISNRKGMMQSMKSENGLTTIEFEVPTR
jgi:predicted membrane GTPase involved in stress response